MNHHLPYEQSFTSLEQLRAYHNERFIRLSYLSILSREADQEGLHHYLLLFKQNLAPSEFLTAILTSPEAQSCWLGNKNRSTENSDNTCGVGPTIASIGIHNLISQQTCATLMVQEISIDRDLEKMPNLLTVEDLVIISKGISY